MIRGLLLVLTVLVTTAGARTTAPRGADAVEPSPPADTYRGPVLPRPLPFFYDLYAFRGEDGNTTVVSAFAVEVRRLAREWHERSARYRFDVSLVLADTALHTVARTDDSVYVSVPRPLDGDHLLYTHVEIQTAPSTSTVQRVTMSDAGRPGTGQLYTTEYIVPDYSGDELMVSDIAMGQPNPRIGWKRRNVTLALLPTSQFPGSSFELYYEIYNLPSGTTYTTRTAIAPVDESGALVVGADGVVDASFSSTAPETEDGTLGEFRTVQARLATGTYRITIQVTDDRTGETATNYRNFRVRGPGRGATMVPALPSERGRIGG